MTVPYAFASVTTSIPLSQLDANFNTAITLGNTAIQLGNTVTTLNNMTLANVTISSGSTSVTSETISGNLTFTGTGNRIIGDFTNSTVTNRLMFQTSTTNGTTNVSLIPNGTATGGSFAAYGNSSPGNASRTLVGISSTSSYLWADKTGTGSYLPLTFQTSGNDVMVLDTDGRIQINGTSTALSTLVGTANTFPLNLAQTAYQFRADATFGTLNTSAVGFGSTYQLPATGTLSSSYQFYAGDVGSGGATLTNNYGLYITDQTISGTNRYGVYSNLSSGTTKWNFYANGTADNAYRGNSRFGGLTAPTVAVDVTGAVLATGNITGGYNNPAAGTTAMAFGSYNVVKVTPNATATYTTTVPAAGTQLTLIILTSGTTSYTITFGTGFKTTGTLATGATSARYFMISFVSDGTNVLETARTVAIA